MKTNLSFGIFGFPKSGNNLANKIINSVNQPSREVQDVYDIHVALRLNELIPPHPFIGLSVYKSHSAAPIDKTLNPHYPKSRSVGIGITKKAILITRIPIDVLFSFINFRRLQVLRNKAIFNKSRFIREYLGLSGIADYNFFAREATYENLSARGCLKSALHAFSVNGLAIPDLYGISGTWPSHLFSWMNNGYSSEQFLRIRYEDVFLDREFVAKSISNFLSIDKSAVLDAISHVNISAAAKAKTAPSGGEKTNESMPSFINKVRPYYSLDFLDKKFIENFLARHHGILRACGYDDFLALLESI